MGIRKKLNPETRPFETGDCRHHWIIETPGGTVSSGRCRLCGEETQFPNSVNDYKWNDYERVVGLSRTRQRLGSALMEHRWYTTAEVAQRVGVSIRRTLRLIRGKELAAKWIGGSVGYRIKASALETYLRVRQDRT